MLFNSLSYLIFLPLVSAVYFSLPAPRPGAPGFRWAFLLAASCVFYMWLIPQYILVLFASIAVDYFAAIRMEEAPEKKRTYFILSVASTLSILFVFKYFNFFSLNVAALASRLGLETHAAILELALPVGLSFHTFQGLSYVIEVYHGRQTAERRFGFYALYVMFFPQLVAGPIERPQDLLPQFREAHEFDYDRVTEGFRRITWGLFKKVVIADRFGAFVDLSYSAPGKFSGITHALAAILFSFQIYCDFSGYSDIAIGSARILGIRLSENFRRPYSASSLKEFWGRWHITLSSWFRDYVYIPLGGNRGTLLKTSRNIFLSFCLSGLWHGASWTFVAWGFVHALFLTGPSWRNWGRLPEPLRIAATFGAVSFAWIFFRADDLGHALQVIRQLGSGWDHSHAFPLEFRGLWVPVSLILIAVLLLVERALERPTKVPFGHRPLALRWSVYYALIFSIIFLGVHGENQFIYFQF